MLQLVSFFRNATVLLSCLLVTLILLSPDCVEAFCVGPPRCSTSVITDRMVCIREPSRRRKRKMVDPTVALRASSSSSSSRVEKDDNYDEPLSVIFQRAMVLQRAGNIQEALENYQLFCKAAEQLHVNPSQYAEVNVNMGAIYLKMGDKEKAKLYLEQSLKSREIGMTYVNLAVLHLQEATSSTTTTESSRQRGLECINIAKDHCEKAVKLNDDPRTVDTAKRLLSDIDKMLRQ